MTSDPADFYTGIVVDAYARLKSASFDAAPYAALVRRHGEPALEIGCGDGEPLLDLVAEGLDVEGVDSSADMVARCREHAERRGLRVRVHAQRVEDLALDRRFATVFLAGPTFCLLPDDVVAARALVAIREHLTDDGVASIPLWIPGPTPVDALGVTRSATADDGAELRYTPVAEDRDETTRTRTTRTRYERVSGAASESVERDWIVHWHTPETFTALCVDAGLEVVALVDDDGRPVEAGGSSFTATVARRAPAGSGRIAG